LDVEEAHLIARVQANDPAALGEVYDRYATRIYTYLYHRLGDRFLAEDLTSEVFVRMLEAARSRRFAQTSLSGWLYRIAHNLVVDHYRSRDEPVPLDEGLVDSAAGPASSVEARLAQEELRMALEHLTEDQQQVIYLRFGEGLTAKQVAEVLGKPETAVWSLQHRALARLQRIMGEGKS
jgi:RNA polymerase sigma-70 factor (ECF subfamily)